MGSPREDHRNRVMQTKKVIEILSKLPVEKEFTNAELFDPMDTDWAHRFSKNLQELALIIPTGTKRDGFEVYKKTNDDFIPTGPRWKRLETLEDYCIHELIRGDRRRQVNELYNFLRDGARFRKTSRAAKKMKETYRLTLVTFDNREIKGLSKKMAEASESEDLSLEEEIKRVIKLALDRDRYEVATALTETLMELKDRLSNDVAPRS